MTHPSIRIETAGAVTTVTIDRPRRKNACTTAMWTALREGFRQIAESPARAVVITGRGATSAPVPTSVPETTRRWPETSHAGTG